MLVHTSAAFPLAYGIDGPSFQHCFHSFQRFNDEIDFSLFLSYSPARSAGILFSILLRFISLVSLLYSLFETA